jgi:uncharacterized membrane protein
MRDNINEVALGFFVYLVLFYLSALFTERFNLQGVEIFINSIIASVVTVYVLNKLGNKND